MIENYPYMRKIAAKDVDQLEHKGKTYGASWRSRGGIGAFMMLARKWDRIEQQTKAAGYDLFEAIQADKSLHDGLLDDIGDLRRYLLLVEGHVTQVKATKPGPMLEMGVTAQEVHQREMERLEGKGEWASGHEPEDAVEELCGPGKGYVNQG